VKDDFFTSVHNEEFECVARDTKLGPEEITRDIPNVGEDALKDLDESGIIRIGAEVRPGDILIGKITPKGETQLSPEEKLLRAIFGEKASDVKDTSLRVPPGMDGTVIDVRVFTRDGVEKDSRALSIERAEIEKVFKVGSGIERIYFPEESGQISDRAVLAMIVLAPEHTIQKEDTLWLIDEMTRQVGSSGRTFKSALLWMVAEDDAPLKEEARKLLAWEVIEEEHARNQLQLDETQERQLQEALGRSRRDLREAVWRQYKNLVLLDKENELKTVNLGLVHSSAAESLVGLVLNRLRQMDEVVDTVSPNFLLRNWIASAEWSTRAVRDAFFASPRFPRLTNSDAIRETIARGVSGGLLGYVGKMDDKYQPFIYNQTLNPLDVEISEDLFIISKETAESYLAQAREKPVLTTVILEPSQVELSPGGKIQFRLRCLDQRDLEMKPAYLVWSAEGGTMDQAGYFVAGQDEGNYQVSVIADQMSATSVVVIRHGAAPTPPQPPPTEKLTRLEWEGVIPSQKWMNFYTRVLARFATQASLKLSLRFEVTQPDGISPQKVDETRAALHDLGLDETLHTV
jgi:hypothetical protein